MLFFAIYKTKPIKDDFNLFLRFKKSKELIDYGQMLN